MAVLTWVLVLTVLFVTGRNRPLSGYERLRECLNGQAVMLSGRIRRITGSSPDETYYIDHIRIKNTETYMNTKISSVTYAGEIFLSVPADMKIMVRSGSGPTRNHDSRERRLRCEDQVIVSGTAVFPERPSNPGQFDDELYAQKYECNSLADICKREDKITEEENSKYSKSSNNKTRSNNNSNNSNNNKYSKNENEEEKNTEKNSEMMNNIKNQLKETNSEKEKEKEKSEKSGENDGGTNKMKN